MKRKTLSVEKRTVLGKKVRHLRKTGLLPLSLYGKNIKSQSLQTDVKTFTKIFEEVGQTGLVDVMIANDKKTHTVLINNPQYDPIKQQLLHIDLHEVELKEKLKVPVPIELSGTSPAAEKGLGVLLQLVNELEVEALPTDLPESIKVDITSLVEIGNEISVASIKTKKVAYMITNPDETIIVRINPLEKEVVVEAPVAEVPAEGEAVAETPAPTEAEAQAQTETPPSEKPKQE
jgi:large subunit ribosomal protein L25